MIVAGIGCRAACPGEAIVALVHEAERRSGCTPTLLATACFKAEEPGIVAAARLLGLPLMVVDRPGLEAAQPHAATRSAVVLAATGLAAVAEAAALAAAGPGATLLLPRIASDRATCALAQGRPV